VNLFDITLKLNGFPIEKAKKDLLEIQNLSEKEYLAYLAARKQTILQHHLQHNGFYSNFLKQKGNDASKWETIPVLTKADLQIPLQNRLSNGYTIKNCHAHKTSGSSGRPLIFAKDKYAHAITWANFMNRYNWHNIDVSTSKQARFYGIPLKGLAHYKERLKDVLGNRFRFSVFDLSVKQFESNLLKFESKSFQYINGYTSAIVQFAKYLQSKNIILKTICPSLKVCIVTAEMLFEEDRYLLTKQLGIPVVNEYGSAELGLIAFTNSVNEWVINREDLLVEILDDDGNAVPSGKQGRVVVTALYNYAHPFIRYDIGDIGTFDESSTIKKPLLKQLLGRTSDLVLLPSGKKAAGLTFYYVTKTIIENDANVKEFVIEQLRLDYFKIRYVSSKAISKDKVIAIKKAVTAYLEPNLNITLQRVEVLERSASGKLKQFTSFIG
jgi:phenylacetate-CoA ligase